MILIGGACLGGWAMLTLLGAERQRLLSEREAAKPRHPQPLPPAAMKPPAPKPAPRPRQQADAPAPKKRSASNTLAGGAAANAR